MRGAWCSLCALAVSGALAPAAHAQAIAPTTAPTTGPTTAPDEPRAVADRVAVRFYAPETGGATGPRYITERTLAFEARLAGMGEEGGGDVAATEERRVQAALERHVVEELLATLQLEGDKASAEPARLAREARADVEQRARGAAALRAAAEEEGLSTEEVDAVFMRRGRAAAYLDRAVTRFLRPTDEQLRDVYRTSPHPFRARPFEDVRVDLARWFVFERLTALEATFLQTARSRVTVVVVSR
jgi:hypothetical protein